MKSRSGFTIVELLIVIVVIAVLAAISVVAYSGIQQRATEAAVRSDLSNFVKKIEILKIENEGAYPLSYNLAMGIKATKNEYMTNRNNWYFKVSSDGSRYVLGVVSKYNKGYFASSFDGINEDAAVSDATTNTKLGSTIGLNLGGYLWNPTTSTGAWNNSWING